MRNQQLGIPGGRVAEAVVDDFGTKSPVGPAVPSAATDGVDPAIVGEGVDPVAAEPAVILLIAPDAADLSRTVFK